MFIMKVSKTVLIILILNFSFINTTFSQVLEDEKNQSPQELYDFHISKRKANNTAGWITFGGGIAMIVGGFGINTGGGIIDNDSTNNNKGLWLSYLGGATTLASIPLFISAGKHKKKANIQLQNGALGFKNEVNFTGVSLVVSF